MKRTCSLLALLLVSGVSAAQIRPQAAFTIAETGRAYHTLGDAVTAIGDRNGIIVIAPGTYRECVVQEDGSITYRAIQPGTVIFDGTACEGKAAFVLRGHSAEVHGIIFQNMRVPDGNGAGIRLERGDLSVTESVFRDSEEGILTHDDPAATIRIDRSTFSRLGRCDRDLDCAHGIYVNHYAALVVTNSRFEAGNGGHYVKSRAMRVDIRDNSFDDSAGRATNYMIDLSNGSSGAITGNIMVQGRDKENYSAFITIAPEGKEHDSSALIVRDNRASFVPGLSRASTFVANWTHDDPVITANILGEGIRPMDQRP